MLTSVVEFASGRLTGMTAGQLALGRSKLFGCMVLQHAFRSTLAVIAGPFP